MMEKELEDMYYKYLLNKIGHDGHYGYLMWYLHNTPFTYSVPMDANRYEDGVDMRYHFAIQKGIDWRYVSSVLDNKPCSMLEMMAVLAIDIAKFMEKPDEEEPDVWYWFYKMLENCGLDVLQDYCFDEEKATAIINTIIYRQYEYDGSGGGLFIVQNPRRDMRNTELWYQAMWWVNQFV